MRVTEQIFKMESRSALRRAENENSELQLKIASGKEISQPSDDPLRFVTAERFRATIRAREQTLRNISDARRFLDNNDGAVRQIVDTLQRLRTLLVRSANETNTTADLRLTAREFRQQLESLIQFANADGVDGRIFGGSRNDADPFEVVRGANDDITNVIYRGDTAATKRQIGERDVIDVNFVGSKIFQVDPQTVVSNQGVPDAAAPLAATLGADNPEGHFTIQGERVYFNTAVDSLAAIAERINAEVPSAVADVIQNAAGPPPDFRLRVRPRDTEQLFLADAGAGRFLERLGVTDGTANAPANVGPGQTPASASNLSFFDVVIRAIEDLENGDFAAIRDERLVEMDRGLGRLDRLMGEVGGMFARLETAEGHERDFIFMARKVISENEDLDYGQAVTDLRQAQLRLQTAIGAAQNLPTRNLLQFL